MERNQTGMNGVSKLYHYLRSRAFALSMQVTSDTKPCSDTTYATSATDAEKKIYEANDKAYQQLIMSCTGIAFGFGESSKNRTFD